MKTTLASALPQAKIQYCICIQGNAEGRDEALSFAGECGSGSKVSVDYSALPLGITRAAQAAFKLVEGQPDAYLMMDCDLNHQPEELPRFLECLTPGSVVVGSRYVKGGSIVGMPIWKRVLSKWVNHLLSLVLRLPVVDKTSGYRLIAAPAVSTTVNQVRGRGFDFYIEFLLRLHAQGLKVMETPIEFRVRSVGVSKMRVFKTFYHYIRLIVRLFYYRFHTFQDGRSQRSQEKVFL